MVSVPLIPSPFQDLVSCSEKAPQALGPPMALKFHLSLMEQQVEAARTFLLPPPGADLVGGTFPSASEQKMSLHELLQGLEQGLPCRPAALSPLEGMEASVTTVDGQREDDITVREGTGLDSASLDSLYSLFYGKPCWMPCQALAPFQATAGTANSTTSGSPGNHDPSMEEHLAVMYEKLQHEVRHGPDACPLPFPWVGCLDSPPLIPCFPLPACLASPSLVSPACCPDAWVFFPSLLDTFPASICQPQACRAAPISVPPYTAEPSSHLGSP